MWKLKESAENGSKMQNALKIKEMLESLRGKIPGMIKIEVGIDFSKTADSADVVLCSEFENRESLNAYQIHPEHEKAKQFIMAARSERRFVDYESL